MIAEMHSLDDQDYAAWEEKVKVTIRREFGPDSPEYEDITSSNPALSIISSSTSDAEMVGDLKYDALSKITKLEAWANYEDSKMTDKEQLMSIQQEGKNLIANMVSYNDPEFTKWKTKVFEIMASIYGEGSREYNSIAKMSFGPKIYTSRTTNSDILEVYKKNIEKALSKLAAYIELMPSVIENSRKEELVVDKEVDVKEFKVFLVIGHDVELTEAVKEYLLLRNIEYVVLAELANRGKTILEKLEEAASTVSCAISLLTSTPDDPYLRPNVVFETGYFAGLFGRNRVIAVSSAKENLPSDLHGLGWVSVDDLQNGLDRELKALGVI